MVLATWLKESLNKRVERAEKQGLERGLEQGREQGLERGLEQGLEQGREQGRRQGLEQASNEYLEADSQRLEGETLAQAVERIRKEKAQQK